MTIYERIKPYDINKNEYEKFLSNNRELAREYAYNLSLFNKNKAEMALEDVNYELVQNKFLIISAPAMNVPIEAPILDIKTTRIILKNLFLKKPLKEKISSGIL